MTSALASRSLVEHVLLKRTSRTRRGTPKPSLCALFAVASRGDLDRSRRTRHFRHRSQPGKIDRLRSRSHATTTRVSARSPSDTRSRMGPSRSALPDSGTMHFALAIHEPRRARRRGPNGEKRCQASRHRCGSFRRLSALFELFMLALEGGTTSARASAPYPRSSQRLRR